MSDDGLTPPHRAVLGILRDALPGDVSVNEMAGRRWATRIGATRLDVATLRGLCDDLVRLRLVERSRGGHLRYYRALPEGGRMRIGESWKGGSGRVGRATT